MIQQNKSSNPKINMLHKKRLPITLDKGNKNRVSQKATSELGSVFNSFAEIFGFNKEGGTK